MASDNLRVVSEERVLAAMTGDIVGFVRSYGVAGGKLALAPAAARRLRQPKSAIELAEKAVASLTNVISRTSARSFFASGSSVGAIDAMFDATAIRLAVLDSTAIWLIQNITPQGRLAP